MKGKLTQGDSVCVRWCNQQCETAKNSQKLSNLKPSTLVDFNKMSTFNKFINCMSDWNSRDILACHYLTDA